MKMNHLNSICFICLNNDIGLKTYLNNTQNDTVTEVKYVLPELTILDSDIPMYICYSCHSTIHSFYTFKKKCLENYSRLKSKVNTSDESSRKSVQEVNIKLEITEEIEDVSQSWQKEDTNETEVEDNIDIKEELIVSSDADLECSPRLEFLRRESVSDSELDADSNSMSQDNYPEDKSDTEFSTHTDNQDFAMPVQSHIKIHEGMKYFKCSIQEMDIKLEITEESEDVSQSRKKEDAHETEVEDNIDIKEELIVSSDANLEGSPRLEFVKCESVSDSELDDGSNSMSDDNYYPEDKSDTDTEFSTHTDNQDFTMPVQSHMKIHEGIKYFTCSICNKGFMRKSDLERHMKIHDGIKDFKCCICNKKFTQKNTLQRHMKTHEGIKNYKCSICNKVFIRKSNFKEHLKIHEDIKDFKCSICNKEFIRKYDLERHLKIHDSIKSFKCLICNKVFTRKSNFKVHQKIHKIHKDFKCSMCNKEFMRKGDLERHMKIHEGIKSFRCSICNKGFMRKSDLERHVKTHTGVTQTEENQDN